MLRHATELLDHFPQALVNDDAHPDEPLYHHCDAKTKFLPDGMDTVTFGGVISPQLKLTPNPVKTKRFGNKQTQTVVMYGQHDQRFHAHRIQAFTNGLANVIRHPLWQEILEHLGIAQVHKWFNREMAALYAKALANMRPPESVQPSQPRTPSPAPASQPKSSMVLRTKSSSHAPASPSSSSDPESSGKVLVYSTQDPRAAATPPYLRERREATPEHVTENSSDSEPASPAEAQTVAPNIQPASTPLFLPSSSAPSTQPLVPTSPVRRDAPILPSGPAIVPPSNPEARKRKERAQSVSEAGRALPASANQILVGPKARRADTEEDEVQDEQNVMAQQLVAALNRHAQSSALPPSEFPIRPRRGVRARRARGVMQVLSSQDEDEEDDANREEMEDDKAQPQSVNINLSKAREVPIHGGADDHSTSSSSDDSDDSKSSGSGGEEHAQDSELEESDPSGSEFEAEGKNSSDEDEENLSVASEPDELVGGSKRRRTRHKAALKRQAGRASHKGKGKQKAVRSKSVISTSGDERPVQPVKPLSPVQPTMPAMEDGT